MIEFLAGVLIGMLAGVVRTIGHRDRELEAENRALREALRRVRLLVRAQRPDSFIGGYIDHVLSVEAGA